MQTAVSYSKASLSFDGARQVIDAATEKAGELGVPVAVAVLDESAQLKAFTRMDGVGLLASEVALSKAYTSAATGVPTSGVHQFIAADEGSLLSMPHLPRFTVVAGGLPIVVDGDTIGAVGVSGGPADVDRRIAEAAAGSAA